MKQHPITQFIGDYRWLSNFWPAQITIDEWTFPTVENAYQAHKTSREHWWKFTNYTPAEAKKLGRRVPLWPLFNEKRLEIMHSLLQKKFEHHSLAQKLIRTGDATLIEGNYWGDTFWGICRGEGHNHLGKLLMQIRSELQTTEQ